jgi:hypothetical protein
MSLPIPLPSPDDGVTLQRLQCRVRALNSFLVWQARIAAEHERREAELASLRAQLAAAQHVIQSLQYGLGLDPAKAPPPQLITAWHTGSTDFIPAFLDVDGTEWLILVDGAPRVPNPVKEYEDWQRMKASIRRTNEQVNRHSTTMEGEQ